MEHPAFMASYQIANKHSQKESIASWVPNAHAVFEYNDCLYMVLSLFLFVLQVDINFHVSINRHIYFLMILYPEMLLDPKLDESSIAIFEGYRRRIEDIPTLLLFQSIDIAIIIDSCMVDALDLERRVLGHINDLDY